MRGLAEPNHALRLREEGCRSSTRSMRHPGSVVCQFQIAKSSSSRERGAAASKRGDPEQESMPKARKLLLCCQLGL